MTPAPAFAFPPGRALAGWWRQLASFHPLQLAVAHLLVHRVEALVAVEQTAHPDRFAGLLLRALTLTPEGTPEALDRQLGLGSAATRLTLARLQTDQLVEATAPDQWRPSPLGSQAIAQGCYTRLLRERRAFSFLDRSSTNQSPHFLPLQAEGNPWPAPDNWRFDMQALGACVGQTEQWKRKHGFPLDVKEVLHAPGDGWQCVVVDTPEHHVLALVTVAANESLLGFAVRQETWTLHADRPAMTLETGWQQLFPAVAAGLSAESGRQAWLHWCQQRSLPPADAAACAVQPHASHLAVHAPQRLIERIRAERAEPAWLLSGSDSVQIAARVELTASSPAGPVRRPGPTI